MQNHEVLTMLTRAVEMLLDKSRELQKRCALLEEQVAILKKEQARVRGDGK